MRSLFFRIFLWFWIAVVVLAVTFAGIIVTTRFASSREHLHAFRTVAAMSARAAAISYEQLGAQGLREVVHQREGSPNYVYFFDQQITELQGFNAPSEVRALARSVLTQFSEKAPKECLSQPGWIACEALGSGGVPYVLVMPFRFGRLVSPAEWAILIPSLMTVAGLVCFWLARYLTQPISRLRRLTGRFAEGDLAVRVGDYSAYSHSEELEGLAHDFDHMAERIQALIERQKHLLWDVSHELRTPLTRIGLAVGLTRQRLPGQLPKEFGRIDRELERLNQLIGQILTIAQLESGSRENGLQRIQLPELIEEIVRDAAIEADVRQVKIRVESDTVVPVVASRDLLRVAIENILRNAIRHTAPSSTVTVQSERAGGEVSVTISDQGPGVAESDLPRLFEPFFRSAEARLRHPGGRGLGLAMTKRIVEWHGGSIAARNQAAGGLVIQILFPDRKSSDADLPESLDLPSVTTMG
jgi:two-component system sensor histidine kinase CpxA